jgi:hypothetical protein
MTVMNDFSRVVDDIRSESRKVDPLKVFYTLLAVIPFVIGVSIAALFKVAWSIFSFVWTAGVAGYRLHKPTRE